MTVNVVTAECESSQHTKVGLACVDSEIGVGRDTGRDSTLGETKNRMSGRYGVTSPVTSLDSSLHTTKKVIVLVYK